MPRAAVNHDDINDVVALGKTGRNLDALVRSSDRGLIAGQPYRDVLRQRIETVKAVVVLWTENSIGSKWVRAEADLADKHGKLICLRDPKLAPKDIPMPFAANDHIIQAGDLPGLLRALALKGARPRI